MDLSKIEKFFTPNMIPERVHIIGCGSVGSTLAELLARYGLTKFTLWDMDIVEPKNIANQMFFHKHIGMKKVDAVADIICMVNPEAKEDIVLQPNGWHGEMVRGYVFLAVDNIEIRKEFVKKNQNNPFVKAVFDIRTGLTDLHETLGINSMQELLDDKVGIRCGVQLLAYHKQYTDDDSSALLRYQVGAGRYNQYLKSGEWSNETHQRVLTYQKEFKDYFNSVEQAKSEFVEQRMFDLFHRWQDTTFIC